MLENEAASFKGKREAPGLPGGPVAKTRGSHCRAWVPSLDRELLRNPTTAAKSSHATAETWCSQINYNFLFFFKESKNW